MTTGTSALRWPRPALTAGPKPLYVDGGAHSIRRSDENISSAEVETVVNSHPHVQESAAYGILRRSARTTSPSSCASQVPTSPPKPNGSLLDGTWSRTVDDIAWPGSQLGGGPAVDAKRLRRTWSAKLGFVSPLQLLVAGGAGFAAGVVNALAGGGTLISFPVLIALGLPPVSANITNTVALSPGYLGGALAQRSHIVAQRARVRRLSVAAALGGLTGSILLVFTSDSAFRLLIPVLLLVATLLLAFQDRLRNVLRIGPLPASVTDDIVDGPGRPSPGPGELGDGAGGEFGDHPVSDPAWLVVPVLVVSVYGGYFGAGLGIMLLAVMGIVLHDPLPRINALKQALSLVINATAAVFFLASHKVFWVVALVMAAASLLGGAAGGRLAGAVKPQLLRTIVVVIGLSVSVAYAVKTWF